MHHLVRVSGREDQLRFCELPGLSALTPDIVTRHCPQASWMLLDDAGAVAARCSLWWRETPAYSFHRLGLIGHYAAHDAYRAAELLRIAKWLLGAQGCTLAV